MKRLIIATALVIALALSAGAVNAFAQSATPWPTGTPGQTVPQPPDPAYAGKIEFTGAVQAMESSEWKVSGLTVDVDDRTEVKGQIQIGDIVKVEGTLSDVGVILAKEIKAKDHKASKPEKNGKAHGLKGQGDEGSGKGKAADAGKGKPGKQDGDGEVGKGKGINHQAGDEDEEDGEGDED